MQRANGDWFALEHQGSFRVPVFPGNDEAMRARSYNTEMLLFKPVILDERALNDLELLAGGNAAHFWLVKNPFIHLRRGSRVEYEQLAVMCGQPNGR